MLLSLLGLALLINTFLHFLLHFILNTGCDDFLFQVNDVFFEITQMLFMQLFFKIELNTVDSMLLVQLIGQILKLSMDFGLFLSLGKSSFFLFDLFLISLLS